MMRRKSSVFHYWGRVFSSALVSLVFILFSCQNNRSKSAVKLEILNQLAKGFEILEGNDFIDLSIGKLKLYFKVDSLSLDGVQWKALPKRFAIESTTHLGYLNALGALDNVIALGVDTSYIVDDAVRKQMTANEVLIYQQNELADYEQLLFAKPDVLFYYPFSNQESALLNNSDILQIPIAEYLEEHPLGQLEWLYVFGLITGKYEEAKALVKERIALYEREVSNSSYAASKRFFLDLPFNGAWTMAPANSSRVKILKDAGLNYLFSDRLASENLTVDVDEILLHTTSEDLWVVQYAGTGDFDQDLLRYSKKIQELPSLKSGNVFYCDVTRKPIFENGYNLNPHLVLQDFNHFNDTSSLYSWNFFQPLKSE